MKQNNSIISVTLFLCLLSQYVEGWLPSNSLNSPRRANALYVATPLDNVQQDEALQNDQQVQPLTISLPKIRYTVPKMKLGWQDEAGIWWDEDGKRNGPPQNYWRQRADEQAYEKDMKLLQDALDSTLDLSTLKSLVRFPMTNNKLLGVWAPVVQNGNKIAEEVFTVDENDSSSANLSAMNFPNTIAIARDGARKLGATTGYGTFDAHLTVGEQMVVSIENDADGSSKDSLPARLVATKDKEEIQDLESLKIGKIRYLSEYILIMESDGGNSIQEVWMRAKAVESVSKDEAAKIRAIYEEAEAMAPSWVLKCT